MTNFKGSNCGNYLAKQLGPRNSVDDVVYGTVSFTFLWMSPSTLPQKLVSHLSPPPFFVKSADLGCRGGLFGGRFGSPFLLPTAKMSPVQFVDPGCCDARLGLLDAFVAPRGGRFSWAKKVAFAVVQKMKSSGPQLLFEFGVEGFHAHRAIFSP